MLVCELCVRRYYLLLPRGRQLVLKLESPLELLVQQLAQLLRRRRGARLCGSAELEDLLRV